MSLADLETPTVQHNLSLPTLSLPANRNQASGTARSKAFTSAELLHPRSIGGVLDLAFDIYRQHFWPLLTAFAVLFIPVQTILFLLSDYWFRPLVALVQANPDDTYAQMLQACGILLLGVPQIGLPGLITFLTLAVASAPLSAAVADIYRGRTPAWQDCYRRVFSRIPALVFTWIVMGLCFCVILVLSFFLDFIAALIVTKLSGDNAVLVGIVVLLVTLISPYLLSMTLTAFWFTFATPLIVLENLPVMAVPSRNWQLVGKARAGRTWIAMVALPIVFLTVQVTMATSLGQLLELLHMPPLPLFLASTALQITLLLFLQPYVLIFLNVLYFDARCQRDALDIHMLAEQLPALRLPNQFADVTDTAVMEIAAPTWMPTAQLSHQVRQQGTQTPAPTDARYVPSAPSASTRGSVLPGWYNHSVPDPSIDPTTIDPTTDLTEVVP